MNTVLAVTGASGAYAAQIFLERCPGPVALVASRWGRDVYERECGPFSGLESQAAVVYDNEDLSAPLSSGSVATRGMVILPCSCDVLAQIAAGRAATLISRAAHCHLKERRPLILCIRESPWTSLDLDNARAVAAAGGIVMPLSPPFYMADAKPPENVNLKQLMSAFSDRVLALLGHKPRETWETVR